MNQLLALEACRPVRQQELPHEVADICTPLISQEWGRGLQNHPDRRFRDYILAGLKHGFHVGLEHSSSIKSCNHNLLSAELHPAVVDEYLAEECNLGRIVQAPKNIEHLVHLSPFGVIPKKRKPGKWRLTVDLSSPDRASMMESRKTCVPSHTHQLMRWCTALSNKAEVLC